MLSAPRERNVFGQREHSYPIPLNAHGVAMEQRTMNGSLTPSRLGIVMVGTISRDLTAAVT